MKQMQIDLPEYILTEELEAIFEILGCDKARLVGGVVRDILNKSANEKTDIDIATTHKAEDVIEILNSFDVKVIPTGLKHGTVTAVLNDKTFEITTLRKDIETDGRHATVEFTDDWEEDAKRRDFTFNAMYLSKNGDLFDYFNGLDDLNNGVVKFVGDPQKRIEEDYLRLLRFARFYARFGQNKNIDSELKKVLSKNAEHLLGLSAERKTSEILKILQTKNKKTVELIDELGFLKVLKLHPETYVSIELDNNFIFSDFPIFTMFYIYGANDFALAAIQNNKNFNFSKVEIASVKWLHNLIKDNSKIKFYITPDVIIKEAIKYMNFKGIKPLMTYEEALKLKEKQFDIKGSELIDLGCQVNITAKVLSKLKEVWLENNQPEKEIMLLLAKKIIDKL